MYSYGCSVATHLCEWLFLGDVSILGRFIAARLSLVFLAEADRPEGPLFLLENEKRPSDSDRQTHRA